jgi:SAM-dependent methyltransferase
MKNAWGYDIPSIIDVLSRRDLRYLFTGIIGNILGGIGKSESEINEAIDILFSSNFYLDIPGLEKLVHSKLEAKDSSKLRMAAGMHDRAEVIFGEIEQYLCGDSLADIGCGHGLISWSAHQKSKEIQDIMLFDVVDYRDSIVSLPIKVYPEEQNTPFEKSFDCTLLLTVLHHSEDPLRLLRHVWNHTNKRLIIIESVFGVSPGAKESPLHQLNEIDQCYYAVFCDWFYNRVLNQDVPVPYNFNTPQKWLDLFQDKLSATVLPPEDLGIDIQIVPEHHFLFVLDKK